MKQSILVVLMAALVSTPCFAQEIEPEGLFSLHETEWAFIGITSVPPIFGISENFIGFYSEKVYLKRHPVGPPLSTPNSFYMNFGVASFFVASTGHNELYGGGGVYVGIVQPIGIGMMTFTGILDHLPYIGLGIGILIKTNDNWIPTEEE